MARLAHFYSILASPGQHQCSVSLNLAAETMCNHLARNLCPVCRRRLFPSQYKNIRISQTMDKIRDLCRWPCFVSSFLPCLKKTRSLFYNTLNHPALSELSVLCHLILFPPPDKPGHPQTHLAVSSKRTIHDSKQFAFPPRWVCT